MQAVLLALLSVITLIVGIFWYSTSFNAAPQIDAPIATMLVVAPGRIEGTSESVAVGTSTSGVVQMVAVKEGDWISEGQLLAQIECSDIAAEIEQRKAEVAAADALHRKFVNGRRKEDIAFAEAELRLAEARVIQAEANERRVLSLVQNR